MKTIKFVDPRRDVEIHLPDGRTLSGPRGTSLEKFLQPIDQEHAPIAGALVDGKLRELTYCLPRDSDVKPVTLAEEDGMRIYRRTLTFLMEVAFEELFPGVLLTIDHSVAAGGYFCHVTGIDRLTMEHLKQVEAHMRKLAAEDIPIEKSQVPISEAIDYFEKRGFDDKVRLLAHRKKDYLILYSIKDHKDYHHGYMLPSTGYVKWFALEKVDDGLTLRFPRRAKPTELSPPPEFPKMLVAFRRYGDLLEKLGIVSVGALNDAVLTGRIREIILVSEALHVRRISSIADKIAADRNRIQIVLISGPSSSGKTTTSRRLTVQLLTRGISPYPLEMDNYFVDRDKTPRDRQGDLDFESLYALDLDRLAEDLQALTSLKKAQLPHFNFRTGESGKGDIVQLEPGQIIIMEGIHGLNPNLLPNFSTGKTFRIYISALTQLNLDRHNRVSTTDTRLIRRIVRDARDRGYTAEETIGRWESVTRGEKRNIFPFQEHADEIFNSALVYELGALKSFAEPLLRQVSYGSSEHVEAKRLLALLDWFKPIDSSLVPDNSLLREFLGGSILKDFRAWNH